MLHDVTRDQFMARHKANHAQLVYAPDAETADKALVAKAAMFDRIGIKVNLVGRRRDLRARREGGAPPENRGAPPSLRYSLITRR